MGNQAFADYVDEHLYDFHHINNKKDPVAISPERFLGYHHPSGEIHIGDDNAWYVCPGKYKFVALRHARHFIYADLLTQDKITQMLCVRLVRSLIISILVRVIILGHSTE